MLGYREKHCIYILVFFSFVTYYVKPYTPVCLLCLRLFKKLTLICINELINTPQSYSKYI